MSIDVSKLLAVAGKLEVTPDASLRDNQMRVSLRLFEKIQTEGSDRRADEHIEYDENICHCSSCWMARK